MTLVKLNVFMIINKSMCVVIIKNYKVITGKLNLQIYVHDWAPLSSRAQGERASTGNGGANTSDWCALAPATAIATLTT